MAKQSKPAIRFKGFTDAWEQRKLTEFVEFFSGLTYTPNDVQENGTLVLRSSNVSNGEVVNADNVYVNPQVVNSENVKVGDIVVVVRNGSRSLIGKHAQIKAFMPNTVIGAFMTGIRSECPEFTNALLNTSRFEEEIAMNMGATINQITGYMFSKMEFKVPCLDEQKKIGEYFEKLDNLITLHQRKYDKLQVLKKAMLEKMFPKNGSSVPEIRFKGFTDAWEQRKLGEVANLLTGFPFESKKFVREGIKLVRGMNVKRGYLDFSEELCECWSSSQGLENYLLNSGDILIQMDGALIGKSYAKIKENQLPALLVQRVTRVRIQNQISDGSFVYQQIQKGFLTYIKGTKTETAVPHLSLNDIESFEIATPSVDEEKKIGAFFESLDHLITLHQRKYDKLQVLKKAMLEKMFPKNGSSVPEIRFKGFTDAWEQRKLEDYLTVSTEKNTGNIYGRSDVLSVSGDYGIVNQIEFQGRSFAGASVSNYGVVQTGDVVYTKSPLNSNPYGIIKTNKGKPGIVSTLYAVYHPKKNAFSDFIQVYFEQHARMNNYMHPLVNKGAKNDMKVSAENALKGPVCFPSRIEQESISAFFSVLDNLITLHQRKSYIYGMSNFI